jgi:hypothetical protein
LEEVRDLQIANGGHKNSPASMGLGTEIAITEAATQIEGIINPLKENVAEVAKESKALNKILTWINTNLKTQHAKPPSLLQLHLTPSVTHIPTYASVAKSIPPKKPNHTIIISSSDVNETGDRVMDTIRKTVDFKNTGLKIDRVRKAKNQKVLLSCEREEDIVLLKREINKNKKLNVQVARQNNPLVIIKNVLSYHSDADIVDCLKAQNKNIFDGLKAEDKSIRLKYRRRARNALQCHPVLEVSPLLHRKMLEAGVVHIGLEKRVVDDQSPLVQCGKCLGFGHTQALCREITPSCSFCGEGHNWQDCKTRKEGGMPTCKNCAKAKRPGITAEPHMASSDLCPEKKSWDNIARSRIAYC